MAREQRAQQPAMTSLPRLEDLPTAEGGYDPERVRDAFDAFRRHAVQLQAQLRVLQAARQSTNIEPTGHAVRMDALHLIREAAEFADVLERDAQRASAAQLGRTEHEVRRRQTDIARRETELERYRQESERHRTEIVTAARNEARQLLAETNRQTTQELREAEARGAQLLEQARHQATELTNSARAEVEQTLEWARAQATVILSRAQQGAEQLLSAAGLGDQALTEVSDAILRAAHEETEGAAPESIRALPEPPAPVAPARKRKARATKRDDPAEPAEQGATEESPEER